MDSKNPLEEENKELKIQVKQLTAQIEKFERESEIRNDIAQVRNKTLGWAGKLSLYTFLGSDLKSSIQDWWVKYKDDKVIGEEETISVLSAFAHRLTRISIFHILVILFPSLVSLFILVWQTQLISSQNEMIAAQNIKFSEQLDNSILQTYITEKDQMLKLVYDVSNKDISKRFRKRSKEETIRAYVMLQKKNPLKTKIDLSYAKLNGLSLSGIDLKNAKLFKTEFKGAELTRADLTNTELTGTDLTDANLIAADLTDASFMFTVLSGADLRLVDLSGADLSSTFLKKADLRGATLINSNLSGVDLEQVNLVEADMKGANLSGANLIGADLSGAKNVTEQQIKSAITDEKTIMPWTKQDSSSSKNHLGLWSDYTNSD